MSNETLQAEVSVFSLPSLIFSCSLNLRSVMPESPKLVFNIEAASPSMVRAMDIHERLRAPDGTSAIDPLRRHLNEVLVGLKEGPSRSLDALYAKGVKRPTAQAESPYVRIVISASPD